MRFPSPQMYPPPHFAPPHTPPHFAPQVISDYKTPEGKSLNRDLTQLFNTLVNFLVECRPLSVSMGNAIKHIKLLISKVSARACDKLHFAVSPEDCFLFMNARTRLQGLGLKIFRELDAWAWFGLWSCAWCKCQRQRRAFCWLTKGVTETKPAFTQAPCCA